MAGDSSDEVESDGEAKPMHGVQGLRHFDPAGDTTLLSSRWKRWKRAFNLFVTARGVTKPEQKLALLLHSGGLKFQDLYYTLVPETTTKTFEESVTILDSYFVPTSNVPFERHQFRQLGQQKGETINQFICRLKQKTLSCEFTDVDNQIRDQVIDKCLESGIRRKFLEKQDATLKDLQDIAQVYESVESQMKSMSVSECNVVAKTGGAIPKSGRRPGSAWKKFDNKSENKTDYKSDSSKSRPRFRCYRCDGVGHFARDLKCPARQSTCTKCKLKGHYAIKCSTKKGGRAYQVQGEQPQNDYAFRVHDYSRTENGVIKVRVGGVTISDVLIDSGASCNIVDGKMWKTLKEKGIICNSNKVSKNLFAYGQVDPIETSGTFECEIFCQSTKLKCTDEFVVVKGEGKSILGKSTSEKLNLLRVGPPKVYSVTSEHSDGDIRSQYKDVFEGVGKLKDYQVKLHIDESILPVAQPVRRVPFGLRAKVEEHLDDLLEKGIIEPVSGRPTKWISPLVVVPKSGGDIRVCVDMRRANEAILRERHPIPTVEEVLQDMNGATVFSKIDLKWGFHQVELEEDSRDITTFCAHTGLYRYTRLMFGINAAPEAYHKVIEDVVKECPGVTSIADDMVIYGCGVREHDERLFVVLDTLRRHGLTANGKKCKFRMTKLTFFGHDLSQRGVSPSEEKIAAITDASEPSTVSEVRSFLGLVQYSAKFLPDLAEVSEPLRRLTRKGEIFQWGEAQAESFSKLKLLISDAETLAYFRKDSKTRVIADAGPTGLGAVLVQLHGENWRVISYASRNLTQVERRYSQTEKEALGLVWACERFNLYIFGREFELETDHKPLECIYGKKSRPSARIERWVLRLQGYQYTVVYRPGKTNVADALSRLNSPNGRDVSGEKEDFVHMLAAEATPLAMSPHQVEVESEQDVELSAIREHVQTGEWGHCKLPGYSCVKQELCVLGKLVLRGTRIVIPQSLRQKVLQLAHEGHQGIVKTKDRLRTKVWWPNMDKDAEKVCKTCHGCQVVGQFNAPEPMQRSRPPEGPWEDIAVDLMGPLPSGESLLVCVDYYSRYFEVDILRATTSDKVSTALQHHFDRYGVPYSMKTDNGRQFVSHEFESFLSNRGITHITSPALWPQANGEVERQNRSLLKALKIAHVEGKPWREELSKYLFAYRVTPHATTGVTPAKLMFNRELRTKLPELRRGGGIVNESTRDRDWKTKLMGKQYSDQKRGAIDKELKPGDTVLLKNVKTSGKLAPNFESTPYLLTRKEGKEVTVSSGEGAVYSRNSAHVKAYNSKDINTEEPVVVESMPQVVPPSPKVDRASVSSPRRLINNDITRRTSSRVIKPPVKLDDYVVNY